MLPLASVTGIAVIAGTCSAAVLFLWWLLRAEARDEQREQAQDGEAPGERPI